ncbi:MAG: cadherin domain-containing protein, partial [Magnetococcales bacterium]|nr:cadherin domain-containing protein [Magnetococcales bacterium]
NTGSVSENAAVSTVVYTATATDVDGGDTQTYSLGGTDGALFTIDGATGVVTLKASADYESQSSYSINVIVTDSGGLTDTQAVTIGVVDVNEAPVITSANTGSVSENAAVSTVVYTATATDPDGGDTQSYSLSGTDASLFAIDATTGEVTLNAAANYESRSSYAFDVIVTDSAGLTDSQSVTVSVLDVNDAPWNLSFWIGYAVENTASSTVIYTAEATDQDAGDTLTYSLGGADGALFTLDATTGALRLNASADYESRSGYSIDVTVTDSGGLTATNSVVISVFNLNEAPTFTSTGVGSVAENAATSTVVYTAVATDQDSGDTQSYSLSGTDASLFTIDATTGEVTLNAAANYESRSSYAFDVVVTDSAGLTDSQSVTVSVLDVNDAPWNLSFWIGYAVENAASSTVIYTAEATDQDAGDTLTYSLGGADGALFTLDATTGALRLNASADYESRSGYSINVTVTDAGGLTATNSVVISVFNLNEAPTFTSTGAGSVAENAATSTVVYTAVATDQDSGDTQSYSLSGTDASLFTIDATTGAVTLNASADYESQSSYAIDVIATDSGGLTDTQTVTITVVDVNETPILTSAGVASVVENTATSTVVYTATATDVDSGDTQTFSLGGTDGTSFTIDAATGEVTLNAQADYESQSSYAIDVTVTDSGGLTDTQTVTITVVDVNETPTLTSSVSGSVAENAAISTVVYTATATDPDAGDTQTFSLSGTDAAAFSINATTGAVTLGASADYESQSSYAITVTVTDADGLTASQAVTIAVSNVYEAPVASAGSLTVTEDQTVTGTLVATSPEGNTLTYSVGTQGTLGTVTITNSATGAYSYTPVANASGSDSFTFTVNDGVQDSSAATVAVTLSGVNDAPVNTVPGAQTVNEDTDLAITGISIADADDLGGNMRVTLSAFGGALTLATTTGLTFTSGDGIGDGAMIFSGTKSALNAALATVTFLGNSDTFGAASITVLTSDLGNSGSGGTLTDSDSIAVTVISVNDAPSFNTLSTQNADEETNKGITGLTLVDVDAGISAMQITLNSTLGVVSLASTSGLTFTTGDGSSDSSMVFSGSRTSINTALSSLIYRGNTNANGSATITVQASDQGNSGSGGAQTGSTTININLTGINDAPVVIAPGATQTFTSSTALSDNFNLSSPYSGTFTWSGSDGLGSGAGIAVSSGSEQVWTSKQGFARVSGNVYSISAYFLNQYNSGYGALGFSTQTPDSNLGSYAAPGGSHLGMMFHGGGGAFLSDGSIQVDGSSGGGASPLSWGGDLVVGNWYRFVLTATALSNSSRFDLNLKIYNSDNSGTLGSLLVEYTMTDDTGNVTRVGPAITNNPVGLANTLYGFVGVEGSRVTAMDNVLMTLNGASATAAIYTEGGSSVVVNDAIVVSDIDDTQISSATVSISSGFTAGDVLWVGAQNGITAFYNTSTGLLTLSGTTSLANYQTALRTVTFSSTSETPTAGYSSRTISWSVTDADAAGSGAESSSTVTSTVTVVGVNDAPTAANQTVTINENSVFLPLVSSFGFADVDGNNLASITITNPGSTSCLDYYNGSSWVDVAASQVFTYSDIQSGHLRFSPTANTYGTAYDAFNFTVNDGTVSSASSYTMTINVIHDIAANTGTSATIALGSSVSGILDYIGDHDWYAVSLTAGSTYQFDLKGAPFGDGTVGDTYLTLYNSNGSALAGNDDYGSLNSMISYTIGTTGTYYLDAAALSDSSAGTYVLVATCTSGDPLVLDLDHNGIQLTSREDGPRFDMNNDGAPDATGWITPGDGLLVMDVNGDGRIQGIGELVSESLVSGSSSSLQSLASFDQNHDGRVDAEDAAFGQLQVWQDVNRDGISDAGELQGLAQLGIVSLGVVQSDPGQGIEMQQGNAITAHATFEKSDGTQGNMVEVAFTFTDAAMKMEAVSLTAPSVVDKAIIPWEFAQSGVNILRNMDVGSTHWGESVPVAAADGVVADWQSHSGDVSGNSGVATAWMDASWSVPDGDHAGVVVTDPVHHFYP